MPPSFLPTSPCRAIRVSWSTYGGHQERAGLVDRPVDHQFALPFLDRRRLAGNHRLINHALATRDLAIQSDFLTGAGTQGVSLVDFFERDFSFLTVTNDPGRWRGQR